MKMDKTLDNIHPNAPKRLVSLWRKLGSDRKVAEARGGINHFYVSELLWRGIEPDDKTEHQQEIRASLFLPRKKRKPSKPRERKPEEFRGQHFIQDRIAEMRAKTTRAISKRWRK